MDWRLKPFQIGNIKKYMKQNLIFVLFFKAITYFSSWGYAAFHIYLTPR